MKNKYNLGIIFIIILIIIYFVYKNQNNNNIIVSSNTTSTTTIANPASEYCKEVGGTLNIKTNGSGNQYGLCDFEDNKSCEEWALFRKECPIGGVKITGYDTIDQKYCAWIGGKTLAVKDSICELPNQDKCSTIDLYNGKCNIANNLVL